MIRDAPNASRTDAVRKFIIYRRIDGGAYLRKRKARYPHSELPRNVAQYRWERRIDPVYLAIFDDTPRDRKNARRLAKKYGGEVVAIDPDAWWRIFVSAP